MANVDFRSVYPQALQNYFPSLSGGSVATLGRTRAALQNARYGLGAAKFMCVGDSTTQGYRSNATINLSRLNGYPPKMAGLLKNAGIPTSYDSIFGNGSNNSADAFNKYDARWSATGTWSSNGFISLGGEMITATAAGTLTFTPTSSLSVDSADIYYRQVTTSSGSFNVNQGGGTNTPVTTTTASNAILKQPISFAATTSPVINIAWASGTVAICGVDVYSSSSPAIRVLNAGIFAAPSATWADTSAAINALPAVAAAAPVLCIVDLGINDWVTSVPPLTYQSNMQTVVSTLLTTSDVIVKTPVPSHISIAPAVTQLQYVQAAEAVAIANGIPYIGGYERFVSYVAANANGLMGDLEHASAIGYGDIAQMVVNGLMAA